MTEPGLPRVALLFAQFSPYHVDRCEAVARRLAGRCDVLAVEVATRSEVNAWDPSGGVAGARKLTLFPDASFEAVAWPRRAWAQLKTLWRCRMVLVGVPYNEPDIIALSWLLRLIGVRAVVLSESKFDDVARSVRFELAKSLVLAAYEAAIVGGKRQADYFRFLGFRRRPVLPGYDTVGIERIRALAGTARTPYAARPFVYVGRFVAKKNLGGLIEGYARYVEAAGANPRRLILAGSGAEESAIRQRVADLGIGELVDFPGYCDAQAVARLLAGAVALVLPSTEEQWGLVVNEALAVGLPVIVSTPVGSRDALVRNLVNGFVVEPGSHDGMAAAMAALAGGEALWRRMSAASTARADFGDADRLADAVELLLDPGSGAAAARIARFRAALAT